MDFEPVEVRHMQPYEAVKSYRCPGCVDRYHDLVALAGTDVVVTARAAVGLHCFVRLHVANVDGFGSHGISRAVPRR